MVTSICTVEDIRCKNDFPDLKEYLSFTEKLSVFSEPELLEWWNRGERLFVIRMLYNAAFSERIIRKDLVEQIGLSDATQLPGDAVPHKVREAIWVAKRANAMPYVHDWLRTLKPEEQLQQPRIRERRRRSRPPRQGPTSYRSDRR